MKHDEIGALRREVAESENRRGMRYSAELKAKLVAYALRRRAAGASFACIGDELGLGYETVRRWCASGERGCASLARTALVPVEIVEGSRSSITIVSPSGFRLEGLDMAEAVAALRALE